MDPEKLAHWQAADALFDQWLDLPATQRPSWLARQDAEPPVLLRLEQLIAAHQRPRASMDPAGGDLAGCQLGDWTLETELGRGGMAVVYRAWREQGMARQQAAVKILTLGALGATGRERFHREAAILARLNHPNVTALVDSGVAEDGTCWLAMPLVDGQRIDGWCEAQSFDARQIVRLYLQVCDAVAYAHRNLVIHRDLKPSNVLVDRDGHVRLLDFGIGQFADADGERTQTMWRALTPGYAAPEQLRGDPPTTAVDVYGLGALLHRLLTGRTPHAATESDTTRPSLLVRDASDAYHRHYVPLKSDLDRVLLKALAEEPGQRYPTAEALADDLRRWLDGQPVLAEKPGLGYRVRKFVARNRMGVAAGVLLAASVAGGIGATLWQAGEARKQAEVAARQAEIARVEAGKANARAERAEDVRDLIGYAFLNARGSDGASASVDDIVQTAADRARSEEFSDAPLTAADILLLTGTVRFNLEDHERSQEDLEDALALLAPHREIAAGELSRAHWELGRHARRIGDYQALARHARAGIELNEFWDAPPTERFRMRIMLGDALLTLDPDVSEDYFRTLLADLEDSDLRETYIHLHVINGLLAAIYKASPEEKLPIQEERLRIARAYYGPGTAGLSFNLGEATHTLRALGMLDRAEVLARESIEAADLSEQRPMLMRGMARCYLGLVLQQRGAYVDSLQAFREGNGLMSQQSDSKGAFGRCLSAQAYAELAGGNYEEAIEALDRSDELLLASVGPEHFGVFVNCGLRASAELREGRHDTAGRVLDACVPADQDERLFPWRQARAEHLLLVGERASAREMLAELRREHAPKENHREWMRPWMASILLAHAAEDSTELSDLAAQLAGYASMPPLAGCLAAPSEESCFALP